MARMKCYAPENGYLFQIVCRNSLYSREFDHCDYAQSREEKKYLIREYRLAYGAGWEFRTIMLPRKFWPSLAEREASEQEHKLRNAK